MVKLKNKFVYTQDESISALPRRLEEQEEEFNKQLEAERQRTAKLNHTVEELEKEFHDYLNAMFYLSCGSAFIICVLLIVCICLLP